MRRTPHEGKFRPKNPQKYIGDIKNIWYRSGLELNAFIFLDNNPFVLKWASEEIKIPYMKPTADGIKPSTYWPDLYVEYLDKDQNVKKVVIEVKPEKLLMKSKARNKKTSALENYTFMINMLKAEAATKWCEQRGLEYRFAVEKNIIR